MVHLDRLNNKDIRMLRSIANGDTAMEMSKKTGYTINSLETIKSRLYRKLGAKNAPNAVAIGYEYNILVR